MIGSDNYFNSLRRGFLIPGAFFLSFFSGVTTPLGSRGYLAVASIVCAAYTAMFIITKWRNIRTGRIKALAMMTFIFILLVNGSPLTTVALVVFNIGMFLILSQHISRTFDARGEDLVFWIWMVFIFISFSSLLIFYDSSLWSYYPPATDAIIPFRLKMMFSEPSHLGVFAVALMSISQSRRLRSLLLLSILLTHSYFSWVILLVLKFRNYSKSLYVVVAVSFFVFVYFTYLSSDLFWQNSGFIRLIGIGYLFQNIDLLDLFVGHGFGAGDIKLTPVFESHGVEQANGFLFSTIYDVGLIGMFAFYYLLCRNIFEVFILSLLLLNFGIGSFILITTFLLFKKHELAVSLEK